MAIETTNNSDNPGQSLNSDSWLRYTKNNYVDFLLQPVQHTTKMTQFKCDICPSPLPLQIPANSPTFLPPRPLIQIELPLLPAPHSVCNCNVKIGLPACHIWGYYRSIMSHSTLMLKPFYPPVPPFSPQYPYWLLHYV